MKTAFAAALIAALGIIVQSLLFGLVSPEIIVPNIPFLVVLVLSFLSPDLAGAILVFCVGIMFDAASGTLLGPWAAVFIVVFTLVMFFGGSIFVESKLALCIVSFVFSVGANLSYLVLRARFDPLPMQLIPRSLTEGLMTAILAPLVWWLFHRIVEGDRKKARPRYFGMTGS